MSSTSPLIDASNRIEIKVEKLPENLIVERGDDSKAEDNSNGCKKEDEINIMRIVSKIVSPSVLVEDEAKSCLVECVKNFISAISCEGGSNAIHESRPSLTGRDILFALGHMGFDEFHSPVSLYHQKLKMQRLVEANKPYTTIPEILSMRNRAAYDEAVSGLYSSVSTNILLAKRGRKTKNYTPLSSNSRPEPVSSTIKGPPSFDNTQRVQSSSVSSNEQLQKQAAAINPSAASVTITRIQAPAPSIADKIAVVPQYASYSGGRGSTPYSNGNARISSSSSVSSTKIAPPQKILPSAQDLSTKSTTSASNFEPDANSSFKRNFNEFEKGLLLSLESNPLTKKAPNFSSMYSGEGVSPQFVQLSPPQQLFAAHSPQTMLGIPQNQQHQQQFIAKPSSYESMNHPEWRPPVPNAVFPAAHQAQQPINPYNRANQSFTAAAASKGSIFPTIIAGRTGTASSGENTVVETRSMTYREALVDSLEGALKNQKILSPIVTLASQPLKTFKEKYLRSVRHFFFSPLQFRKLLFLKLLLAKLQN